MIFQTWNHEKIKKEKKSTVADLDKCVCVCVLNTRPGVLNKRPDLTPDLFYLSKHPAELLDIRPSF